MELSNALEKNTCDFSVIYAVVGREDGGFWNRSCKFFIKVCNAQDKQEINNSPNSHQENKVSQDTLPYPSS